uniref:Polypeptide N-acetylgalactosaminyltransferase n=1 Tax=Steinernema glaseri TaxID=37863 RepID=A0A1I7Y004_9BILA
MATSLKRQWFELRRFLRHRSFVFLLTCAILLGFCFFVAYHFDSDAERTHEHIGHVRDTRIRLPFRSGDSVPQKSWDNEPLAGETDPNTVLKDGILGNYEPPVEVDDGSPGSLGKPVHVDKPTEVKRAMQQYGFNTYVSDMISMNRTVPDVRMTECKYWHYPEELPTASVVIVFHNEGWSPLLRTVHSVLLRSPPHLIKEIILVDDYSDKPHLKGKLEEYIKQFNGKVKLIRNKEREGLIRTRSNGAHAATGDVVIFLDAHCEVNINWLPPLLAPIKNNRRIMTVPVIDGIDMNTWAYRRVYGSADRHFRGIFEWGLLYKETEISERERQRRKHNSEPFRSPTHAGGLFAIDRNWFEELGYYDDGLQIWGGEQYELSFKIWQCGGGILFVPCSHVGHVYRSHMPYSFGKLSGKPVISTNMVRVVKTWMDDYDKYYYIREPSAQHRQPGDISKQVALREKLQCKSFDWFMKNVAYDVVLSYPLLPENDVWGEAKNLHTSKCLDTMGQPIPGTVGATPCHGYGGNQLMRLNKKGQLTQGEWCLTAYGNRLRSNHCQKGTVDGTFKYDRTTEQIIHTPGNTCLTADESMSSSTLTLNTCDEQDQKQKWKWREIFTD